LCYFTKEVLQSPIRIKALALPLGRLTKALGRLLPHQIISTPKQLFSV
jgi:hypothetical protein